MESILCVWVHLERRVIARRAHARGMPPLHRAYGRALARVSRAREERAPSSLEPVDARRRTGLVTFGLIAAAMTPVLVLVLSDGWKVNPVVGQLVGWALLWTSPVVAGAPAKLGALLVAVWRGWVRLDSDGGEPGGLSPLPGITPGSHDYRLAG
jgi:hypothetical protein